MLPSPNPSRSTLSARPRERAPAAKVVVRATLRTNDHEPDTRRIAQELAWDWVRAKWPRLVASPAEREQGRFQRVMPGQAISVESVEGASWTLSLAHEERNSKRTWMTRVLILDDADTDLLAIQTSCTDPDHAPMVVAPPRLLGAWVERLSLQDGGVSVLGKARHVNEEAQAAAFCKHVQSDSRMLPIIALANKPATRFYGVDPRGLAEAVRGLAHVACVAPELSGAVTQRLGEPFGVVAGAARIYLPGFDPEDTPTRHPLLRDNSPNDSQAANDAGAFRKLLCRRICALSAAGEPAEPAVAAAFR